jgi:hypothetical protein
VAEPFLSLSPADRADALGVAATATGRPVHVLEKDVWVVWMLEALFSGPGADHLVFKGGTSLSKAFGVIDRFSEDIDITRDVRATVDAAAKAAQTSSDAEPHPPSSSQARKWRKAAEAALSAWVPGEVSPWLTHRLSGDGIEGRIETSGTNLWLRTTPTSTGWGYMKPDVLVEFGGRSTGLPAEVMPIVCDAAVALPTLIFPTASPRVMAVERTFWEKATAVHAFNAREGLPGDRLSRHWFDLARLLETGHAERALADRDLAAQVARHKTDFFAEAGVDYLGAVAGQLRLVPSTGFLPEVAADYARMRDAGYLAETALSFEALIVKIAELETAANRPD